MKSLNVLYIEDDYNVSQPICSLLETFFHKVFNTQNAEDAINIMKDNSVHIIITDIELPGMSGLELCEEVRKTNQNIPIFITTAHDDNDMLKKAIKLNLVDFLVKPISVESITTALYESLETLNSNDMLSVKINENTTFQPLTGELMVHNSKINMTKNEIILLTFLVENKNKLICKDTIDDLLYQGEYMTDSSYKNLIYRLRKKIGKESLDTIVGVGIKLNL